MTDSLRLYIFFLASTLVAILSFSVVGSFNMGIDGGIYVSQVEQFEAGQLTLLPHDVALRAFKPFVGVWGSLFVPVLTPEESIQLLNLLFLFAMPFVAFKFLSELNFSKDESFWGALWIISGYPVFKYGLAISTDFGGWLFAVLTAYLVLKGIRLNSYRTILLASVLGFIGGTIKEPGVFGLLFGALYIIFSYSDRSFKKTFTLLSLLTFPALILEIILFGVLAHAGFPLFLDWYGVVANSDFEGQHYQLTKLIGVIGSSFNIVLLYAGVGFLALTQKQVWMKNPKFTFLLALLVASLPILLWKIFISRVLYIQFLFFVPMALVGARLLIARLPKQKNSIGKYVVYILPLISATGLFLIAREKSLFTIFF
ncbi:MAG: hypothetical protein WAW13_04895 [Minisyncoccia bacterium]